jgi:site-specific DNA recombinase
MTKRCAVYLRFSDEKQSPMSIDDQLRLCRSLVERCGWSVAAIYEEPAVSAAHTMTRPRYRQMVTDAKTGKFDVIVAESLDRLNRRLEDTARLFNELKFVGAGIVTVSEGPITEMHVSIIGLLAELTLKSISEKTRRGLEGRVIAGKSGGGRAFGYDMVTGTNAAGMPITGERKVNEAEAEIVREICRRFAAGEGPRSIAHALNERGVPGPHGRPWGDTTIRGHYKKQTGILNNPLYIGKQVWGRQRFIKDPSTGRRVARMNPAGSEIVAEVPHLRIVDDQLWAAVRARQAVILRPTTEPHVTNPLNETHRPRFLLSGLLTCGVCGGGYTITAKDRYGCARRGRQGMCSNSRGIKRQELERRILEGLRCTLVTPDLVAQFIDEYRAEWNRLQGERRSEAGQRDRKLADVNRKLTGIVDAIERGIITPTTKERLEALEAEKATLEQVLVEPLPDIHPNLAEHYRSKVAQLQEELVDPELATEAKSMLRAMIKTIKVTPGDKRGCVCLELHGELAAILAITADRQNGTGPRGGRIQASVVAGACNHLDLQLSELLSTLLPL